MSNADPSEVETGAPQQDQVILNDPHPAYREQKKNGHQKTSDPKPDNCPPQEPLDDLILDQMMFTGSCDKLLEILRQKRLVELERIKEIDGEKVVIHGRKAGEILEIRS
jgi:hypothetical protein